MTDDAQAPVDGGDGRTAIGRRVILVVVRATSFACRRWLGCCCWWLLSYDSGSKGLYSAASTTGHDEHDDRRKDLYIQLHLLLLRD